MVATRAVDVPPIGSTSVPISAPLLDPGVEPAGSDRTASSRCDPRPSRAQNSPCHGCRRHADGTRTPVASLASSWAPSGFTRASKPPRAELLTASAPAQAAAWPGRYAVLEKSAPADDGIVNRLRDHHRADRLIARAQPFGDGSGLERFPPSSTPSLPQRPIPHITSSRIAAPVAVAHSRMPPEIAVTALPAPSVAPTTVSATNAITSSAPSAGFPPRSRWRDAPP